MKIGYLLIIFVLSLMVLGSMIFTAIDTTKSESFTNGTDDLLQRYDFNGDGVITFKEYTAMHTDARLGNCPPLNNLRTSFSMQDTNDDGVLSDYELSFDVVNHLNEVYSLHKKGKLVT